MLKSIVFQEKNAFFYSKHLQDKKKIATFAPAIEKQTLEANKGWPVRLSVRTQDFHS